MRVYLYDAHRGCIVDDVSCPEPEMGFSTDGVPTLTFKNLEFFAGYLKKRTPTHAIIAQNNQVWAAFDLDFTEGNSFTIEHLTITLGHGMKPFPRHELPGRLSLPSGR